MLNAIWFWMLVIGILVGLFTGRIPEITEAVLSGGKEAVTLALTMTGVLATWTGLMKVAEAAGLVERLSQKLMPLLHALFPQLPKKHPAFPYIATNFIANFLGLGWAATPAGLAAMDELQKTNATPELATKEMCTFLIINMSSIQLVSINILAYRSQYGSANPAEILGAGLIATIVSTLVAVFAAKVCERR